MINDNSFLKQAVNESGGRLTKQRQLIMDILVENKHQHLTAEEVHGLISKRGINIGLATVYRTLKVLEEKGFIIKDYLSNSVPYYELYNHEDKHQHHHLIYTKCGNIENADDDLLDTIEKIIMLTKKFKIINHKVSFYGICEKCSRKMA